VLSAQTNVVRARSEDGAATDLGFTRDRHQMCASRVDPTLHVRDAAHEAAKSWRTILPAPHHEAGIDRGCIKLIGICFSDYKCPKGAVAAPFGLNTETAQSTFQPEKIKCWHRRLAGRLVVEEPDQCPAAEPDIIILTSRAGRSTEQSPYSIRRAPQRRPSDICNH